MESELLTRELDSAHFDQELRAIPECRVQVVSLDKYTIVTMCEETNAKNIDQADKKLVDLMLFALNHGIENIKIKGKGPLVPFIVTELNGEQEVTRFFKKHLKDGLSEAIRYLKEEQKSHFAVLVYDELLPMNDKKFNAVIARGYDRTDTVGYALAQPYVPSGFFSFFKLAGNKVFLGNADSLLPKTL